MHKVIQCAYFFTLKPILVKHFNNQCSINDEKNLDKRNPGLSLQPAFIKRGCSLQMK